MRFCFFIRNSALGLCKNTILYLSCQDESIIIFQL
jgi:hypothetical protein